MCTRCADKNETFNHIIRKFSGLELNINNTCHDWVGKVNKQESSVRL